MRTLLGVLLLSLPALGQIQMNYNYSSYVNYSADANNIYETAVVDGNASCYPTNNFFNPCPAVQHTPAVFVQLGPGQGENSVGNAVSPETYINLSNSQTLLNYVPDTNYTENNTEKVMCNFAGVVFLASEAPNTSISIRHSAYVYVGLSGTRCAWNPTCKGTCSSPHTTEGPCPSPPPGVSAYKQCRDLVKTCGCGGTECIIYRVFCYDRTTPGFCS